VSLPGGGTTPTGAREQRWGENTKRSQQITTPKLTRRRQKNTNSLGESVGVGGGRGESGGTHHQEKGGRAGHPSKKKLGVEKSKRSGH